MTPGRPPRVLVDATSVPADRGGVGRYVDGLLGALAGMDGTIADIAVVCQRTDAERYARELPSARVVAAPAAAAHRPARLAWEQTGLPLLAQQIGAEVLHSPFYTCPLRISCPVTVTVHARPLETVEPQHVEAFWNDVPAGRLPMTPTWAEYRFRVPATAVRAGTNELVLRFDRAPIFRRVRGDGPKEPRPAILARVTFHRAGE